MEANVTGRNGGGIYSERGLELATWLEMIGLIRESSYIWLKPY